MTDKDNIFESTSKPNDNIGFDVIEAAFKEIERKKGLQEEEDISQEEPELDPQEDNDSEHVEEEEIEEASNEEDIHEEHEEDQSKEARQESPKAPEKAWKEKKRRFKAQAETRAALEEKRKVLEENAYLKELLKQAEAAGTYQYGKNVYSELEKAKQIQKQALAEGNEDAFSNASVEIARALYDIKELEKWSAYENSRPKEEEPISTQEAIEWKICQEWLSTHKELDRDSKHFDPELATKVGEYVYQLDSKINQSGNTAVKHTDEYFEVIDDYIDDLKSRRKSDTAKKNIGSIGHVGSVRNSYSSSLHNAAPKSQKITLTALEKELARNGNISEEEWIKRKMKYQNIKNN